MIIASSIFFLILVFSTNLTNTFGEMPELQPMTPTLKVCSLADTLMTFSDSSRVIKDYMCHSA